MNRPVENVDLEQELARLLGDLAAVQDELLEVLVEKRSAIVAGDMQAMLNLQAREADVATRLQQCHDRRAALLQAAAQQGLNAGSIRQLSRALPDGRQGKLQKQAKETAARMRLLQHHSLANWVLAQRSLLHISQMLEIIASGGQIQPTYGIGQPAHQRGALVDREI